MRATFRFLRPLPPALGLLLCAFAAQAKLAHNEMAIPAQALQSSLQRQFPYTVEAGGVLALTARDPQLDIPASGQRVRLRLHADGNYGGDADIALGDVQVNSKLRYDAATRAFYLDDPQIESVQTDPPALALAPQTRQWLSLWLAAFAENVAVYRLDPALLATFGDIKLQSARIEQGQLVLAFDQPITPEYDDDLQ